ncbi:hypothetical protein T492DRAFT_844438 [Pavlovales sp. CCMP2436]|nr:hypothetical protein T492DRAFT_844438 [Pavlovales sp. CCMP2436]
MGDEPAMKKKKTTEFGRTVKLVARLFDSEGLALVRGSLPRSTYVMQRRTVPKRAWVFRCTPNSCAKKHYHMDFDPNWLCPDAVHPMPQLDSIIAMQEWDSAEEELLLGMLGRLLFPVGRYDNWQACLMLTGVGGSGKTTVTDAVINAGYSPE